MAQILIEGEIVKCFKCGNDDLAKSGINSSGKQRFRCRECRCVFISPFERVKKSKITKVVPVRKPVKINSLVGVPCFCCSNQYNCKPEFCEKLTEWLNNDGNS